MERSWDGGSAEILVHIMFNEPMVHERIPPLKRGRPAFARGFGAAGPAQRAIYLTLTN
jgi:hypothetical protein